MCKVLMIAGIKPKHQKKVEKILEIGAKQMSVIEDDGVGYAAITSKGKIYGEKWLVKDHAFKLHAQPKISMSELFIDSLLGEAAKWLNRPAQETVYARFGSMTKENLQDTVAVIVHARKKTTGLKCLDNTHPFVVTDDKEHPDTALIHNGSIKNHLSLTKKTSTCDSETLLHEYLKNSMYFNPWGITDLAKEVRGEYTVGVLTSGLNNEKPEPYLDIFKYQKDLHVGYCPDIETAIFCTSSITLENIAKEAGVAIQTITEVRDNLFIRINAITGEREDNLIEFKGETDYIGFNSHDYGPHHRDYNDGYEDENIVALNNALGTKASETTESVEDDIETAVAEFEENHKEVFTQKYQQPKLNDAEKEFMQELAKSDKTNFKALRLVQKVLGVI